MCTQLITLHKDPEGDNVFHATSQNGSLHNSDSVKENSLLKQRIKDLEVELQVC